LRQAPAESHLEWQTACRASHWQLVHCPGRPSPVRRSGEGALFRPRCKNVESCERCRYQRGFRARSVLQSEYAIHVSHRSLGSGYVCRSIEAKPCVFQLPVECFADSKGLHLRQDRRSEQLRLAARERECAKLAITPNVAAHHLALALKHEQLAERLGLEGRNSVAPAPYSEWAVARARQASFDS
jgi:hypothetical protein